MRRRAGIPGAPRTFVRQQQPQKQQPQKHIQQKQQFKQKPVVASPARPVIVPSAVISDAVRNTKLLIKWPTRARPEVFLKALEKYISLLSGKISCRFFISCDADDVTMNTSRMKDKLDLIPNLSYHFGHSKSKIEACNADMDLVGDYDILLLASDDMVPEVKGYDQIICEDMQTHYPGFDGVIWYNEGRAGNTLNTLSIMGRKLYEHFGYIYHPDYYSMWCDNEFTDETKRLNKCVYLDKILIRHLWMQTTGIDTLHRRNTNSKVFAKDRQIYLKRKEAGFPKESIHGAG